MLIKNGYNNKETEIKILTQENNSIELWIRESGKDDKETLTYMTPTELTELFKEIQLAGKNLFD